MTSLVSWKINGGQVVESNKEKFLFYLSLPYSIEKKICYRRNYDVVEP